MELNGTLDQFPLSELITMIHQSSVTGVLEIGAAPDAAYLCCRDGRVHHAICGAETGPAALRRIPERQGAPFRFIAGALCEIDSLGYDVERQIAYVAEVERLLKQAGAHATTTDWVPTLCESEQSVQVSMTTWQVLAAIDGERTIAEIAALLDLDPLEICAVVADLVVRRLATTAPQRAAAIAPRPPDEPSTPTAGPSSGRTLGGVAAQLDASVKRGSAMSALGLWRWASHGLL